MINSLLKYIWNPEKEDENHGDANKIPQEKPKAGPTTTLTAEGDEVKTFDGTVTAVYSGYGMVDNEVYFSLDRVESSDKLRAAANTKVMPKVGDKVKVTAFRKNVMGGWRAKSVIICREEEHTKEQTWVFPDESGNKSIVSDVTATKETVTQDINLKPTTRVTVGKVTSISRDDGLIDNIYQFKLVDCQDGYPPFIYDWVNFKLIEDCFTGHTIATDVKPLREQTFEGRINSVQTGFGYIDSDTYFTFTVCEEGYTPRRGDRVCGQAIESSRGRSNWRALSVCPIQDKLKDKNIKPEAFKNPQQTKGLKDLLCDKHGIQASTDVKAGIIELGKRITIPFKISNSGNEHHTLLSAKIHGSISQFYFDEEATQCEVSLNIDLPPGKSQTIQIYCRAINLGMDTQMLVLNFRKFQIGREMYIKVYDPNMKVLVTGPQYEATKGWNRYRAVMKTNTESWLVPGQRPQSCRPNLQLPNRLPHYKIPDQLRDCYVNNENLLHMVPELAEELTMQNYTKKFSTLLHLEEIQEEIDIRNFDLERVCLRPVGEFLALQVPGLAEGRPSVLIGDRVILTEPFMPEQSPEYEGFIHEVKLDEVWMKFNENFHSTYSGQDYNARFTFNRTTLRRCHQAAEFVPKLGEEVLFPVTLLPKIAQTKARRPSDQTQNTPTKSPTVGIGIKRGPPRRRYSESFDWLTLVNAKLNGRQRAAVYRIVNGQSRPTPYILFGPPGTGKTVTLVEAILQIFTQLSGSRILACAPSNSASDLLAERLHQSGRIKQGDMARLNAFQRSEESIPESVKPYVCNGDNLEIVSRYRILICTCTSAGMMYSLGLKPGHFTHVVVDECGQATEPECMIPVGLVAGAQGQVVLAGDPMQLGAVLRSGEAQNYGLSMSLLERLMNMPLYARDENKFADHGSYDPLLVTKLVENYRSHPALISLPSQLFYDNELIVSADKEMVECLCGWEKLPNTHGVPFIFHGMRGEDLREGNSPSWFNPVEAMQVMMYLQALDRNTTHKLSFDEIGIITPYRKQVEKIRLLIGGLGMDKVKVGSVEEFQGQERLVIIISTVRSNEQHVGIDLRHNLGFLSNPKRFNVAITRAQALLIIIGNPHVLYRDPMWKDLICYSVVNQAYTGCELPPLGLEQQYVDQLFTQPQTDMDTQLDINAKEYVTGEKTDTYENKGEGEVSKDKEMDVDPNVTKTVVDSNNSNITEIVNESTLACAVTKAMNDPNVICDIKDTVKDSNVAPDVTKTISDSNVACDLTGTVKDSSVGSDAKKTDNDSDLMGGNGQSAIDSSITCNVTEPVKDSKAKCDFTQTFQDSDATKTVKDPRVIISNAEPAINSNIVYNVQQTVRDLTVTTDEENIQVENGEQSEIIFENVVEKELNKPVEVMDLSTIPINSSETKTQQSAASELSAVKCEDVPIPNLSNDIVSVKDGNHLIKSGESSEQISSNLPKTPESSVGPDNNSPLDLVECESAATPKQEQLSPNSASIPMSVDPKNVNPISIHDSSKDIEIKEESIIKSPQELFSLSNQKKKTISLGNLPQPKKMFHVQDIEQELLSSNQQNVSPTTSPLLAEKEQISSTEQAPSSELESKVIRQMEYYFSDVNLIKDAFLQEKMKEDPGNWLELEVITTFNKMKALTTNFGEICTALRKSMTGLIEIHPDGLHVRRSPSKPIIHDHEKWKQQLALRAVALEGLNVSDNTEQDNLERYLEQYYGVVEHIERWIPKVKESKIDCPHLELVIFKQGSSLSNLPDKVHIEGKDVRVYKGTDYVQECVLFFYNKRVLKLNRYLLKPVRRYQNKNKKSPPNQYNKGKNKNNDNQYGRNQQGRPTPHRNMSMSDAPYRNMSIHNAPNRNMSMPDAPNHNMPMPDARYHNMSMSDAPYRNISMHDAPYRNMSMSDVSKDRSPLSQDSRPYSHYNNNNNRQRQWTNSSHDNFSRNAEHRNVNVSRGFEDRTSPRKPMKSKSYSEFSTTSDRNDNYSSPRNSFTRNCVNDGDYLEQRNNSRLHSQDRTWISDTESSSSTEASEIVLRESDHKLLKYLNDDNIAYKSGKELKAKSPVPDSNNKADSQSCNSNSVQTKAVPGNQKAKLWLQAHGLLQPSPKKTCSATELSQINITGNHSDKDYDGSSLTKPVEFGDLSSVSIPAHQSLSESQLLLLPSPIKSVGEVKDNGETRAPTKPARSSTPLKSTRPLGQGRLSPTNPPGIGRGYQLLQLIGKSPPVGKVAVDNDDNKGNKSTKLERVIENTDIDKDSNKTESPSDAGAKQLDTTSASEQAKRDEDLSAAFIDNIVTDFMNMKFESNSEKKGHVVEEVERTARVVNDNTVAITHGDTQYMINLKPSKLFSEEGEDILERMLNLEKANKEEFEKIKAESEKLENISEESGSIVEESKTVKQDLGDNKEESLHMKEESHHIVKKEITELNNSIDINDGGCLDIDLGLDSVKNNLINEKEKSRHTCHNNVKSDSSSSKETTISTAIGDSYKNESSQKKKDYSELDTVLKLTEQDEELIHKYSELKLSRQKSSQEEIVALQHSSVDNSNSSPSTDKQDKITHNDNKQSISIASLNDNKVPNSHSKAPFIGIGQSPSQQHPFIGTGQSPSQQHPFIGTGQSPSQQHPFIGTGQSPSQQHPFIGTGQSPSQQHPFIGTGQSPSQQHPFIGTGQSPSQQHPFIGTGQSPSQQHPFIGTGQSPSQQHPSKLFPVQEQKGTNYTNEYSYAHLVKAGSKVQNVNKASNGNLQNNSHLDDSLDSSMYYCPQLEQSEGDVIVEEESSSGDDDDDDGDEQEAPVVDHVTHGSHVRQTEKIICINPKEESLSSSNDDGRDDKSKSPVVEYHVTTGSHVIQTESLICSEHKDDEGVLNELEPPVGGHVISQVTQTETLVCGDNSNKNNSNVVEKNNAPIDSLISDGHVIQTETILVSDNTEDNTEDVEPEPPADHMTSGSHVLQTETIVYNDEEEENWT